MKKGYTLMELLVVISIIAFMAVVSVPAFAQYGRSSDFKQKSDEVKMLMERTYLLSRSPENTSVQAYRLSVIGQVFKLQRTITPAPYTSATWVDVDQIKKLDDGSNGMQNLESIQCNVGLQSCFVLTCPTNPEEKCDLTTASKTAFTLADHKITGFKNLAKFTFEGVKKDGLPDNVIYKTTKPFNVILTYDNL
jgi:prepilin-type N-terminal cleavage/methylation domain-containing protein